MQADDIAAMVLAGLWGGLTSPAHILGGLVLGWLSRRWWQVVLAAVVFDAVLLGIDLRLNLPPGGEIVWILLPLGIVGPLAWCSAGFLLRRAILGSDGSRPRGRLARLALTVIGVLAGAAVGAGAGLLLGSIYVELAQVSSFEGQSGYLVVFGFGLPGLLIGAVAGGWLARRWSRPAAQAVQG